MAMMMMMMRTHDLKSKEFGRKYSESMQYCMSLFDSTANVYDERRRDDEIWSKYE
jgi:hypothetical protein